MGTKYSQQTCSCSERVPGVQGQSEFAISVTIDHT